jgi:hypothetical protein
MKRIETYIPLSITVVNPPAGVVFALQRGKAELIAPTMADGSDLSFALEVRFGDRSDETPPNLLGPFVQGPKGGRFVYLNSGTSAGQFDSCWTRRAKIGLQTIGWELIDAVLARPESFLEAKIAGKARDGGPACATVPLLEGGWRLTTRTQS